MFLHRILKNLTAEFKGYASLFKMMNELHEIHDQFINNSQDCHSKKLIYPRLNEFLKNGRNIEGVQGHQWVFKVKVSKNQYLKAEVIYRNKEFCLHYKLPAPI